MAFKKGDKKPPNSGRAKGTPNRSKIEDRDWVYDQLGGREGWLKWCLKNNQNLSQFYKGVEKSIPAAVEMTGKDGGPIQHAVTYKADYGDNGE